MREKRLPFSDAEALDEAEEPTKRPRTRFVELQPSAADPADGIDEEIPGSVRADVEPLVLADMPFEPFKPGDPALSASHVASDPGFARAQRALLRRQQQEQGVLGEALKAQEKYDQPAEAFNEMGDAIEPFNLRKELEEGFFDREGHYLEYEREDEQDAWLDSIEDRVHGTGPDTGRRLPQANEPVAEPPPLNPAELEPYLRRMLELLQGPEETVPAALRRLAGAGPVMDKFGSKEEAQRFWQERLRSGHAVPPGNHQEFQAVTEAAEVLFDAGFTDVYSSTKEQLQQRLQQQQQAELAPPAAAPSRQAAAEAAAQFGGGTGGTGGGGSSRGGGGNGGGTGSPGEGGPVAVYATLEGGAAGTGRRRHHAPPPAGPAAAAEPPISAACPSVPSGQHTAATTRGGAGVGAAAHGFAAELPQDLLGEMPVSGLPPKEVEFGLGLPAAGPTALELQERQRQELASHQQPPSALPHQQQQAGQQQQAELLRQLHQQHAAAMPEGQTAMKAALYGSFADRLPREQQVAMAVLMIQQVVAEHPPRLQATQAEVQELAGAGALPLAGAGGAGTAPGSSMPSAAAGSGAQAGAGQQGAGAVTDEQLEAEFQQAAERHRDAAELAAAGRQPGEGEGATAAAGTDFHRLQQQAVDAPSTKALPGHQVAATAAAHAPGDAGDTATATGRGIGGGGPGKGGGTHSPLIPQEGLAAPGWEQVLHPPALPGIVAELAADPLAYPSHPTATAGPAGSSAGGSGDGGGASHDAAIAGPGSSKRLVPPSASAAANVSFMAGMVQPALHSAAPGSAATALGGQLDSVEQLLEEQEAQAMHHSQLGGTSKPQQPQAAGAVAFNNEDANLVAPGTGLSAGLPGLTAAARRHVKRQIPLQAPPRRCVVLGAVGEERGVSPEENAPPTRRGRPRKNRHGEPGQSSECKEAAEVERTKRQFSELHRQRLSEARRRDWQKRREANGHRPVEDGPRIDRRRLPKSAEVRQRISAGRKATFERLGGLPEEWRKKLSESASKRQWSLDVRYRMSRSATGRKCSPEVRQNMSAGQQRRRERERQARAAGGTLPQLNEELAREKAVIELSRLRQVVFTFMEEFEAAHGRKPSLAETAEISPAIHRDFVRYVRLRETLRAGPYSLTAAQAEGQGPPPPRPEGGNGAAGAGAGAGAGNATGRP